MQTAENPSPAQVEPLLRSLGPGDQSAYEALWRDGLAHHGHFFRSAPEDDAPGIPTRFAPDSFTLGAFLGDDLVGITSLERERPLKLRHKAWVSRMYVRPEHEGSGVGKLLLREALVRAETLGDLRQVCLTVLATNERAQRLYASLGFRGFAREPAAVRVGDTFIDEIQMVRFLRRAPRPAS